MVSSSGVSALFSWPDWVVESEREKAKENAEDQLDEIYEPLREAEDSIAEGKAVAEELCSDYEDLKQVDEELIQGIRTTEKPSQLPTEVRYHLSRLEGIIEVFNEQFNVEIDTADFRRVDSIMTTASKLVPLVTSSKHVVDTGCNLLQADDGTEAEEKAFRKFLMSCGIFTAEVLMIQFSVGYRFSFWATRTIANKLLVRTRGLVGLKVYALMLREVHWTVRESLADVVGYMIDQTILLRDELPKAYETVFEDDDLEALRSLRDEAKDLRKLADLNVLDDEDSPRQGDDWSPLKDDGDILDGGLDLPI